jgi:membrane protease YdiL (CAAX protease family)
VFLAIVVEGGLVALSIGLGWLLDHRPLARFRPDGRGFLLGLAAAVPMLLAFLAMLRWPVGPLRGVKEFTERVVRPVMAPCSWVDLFGISVFAGVGEEMLFRGLMQDVFARWMPLGLAVALASLLFGLMHAVTPAYAVLAGAMGAYLGGVYLWADNLLAAVVAHGAYDFVVLLYLMYGPGSEQEEGADQEEQAPQA